jgi:hypothetical protein
VYKQLTVKFPESAFTDVQKEPVYEQGGKGATMLLITLSAKRITSNTAQPSGPLPQCLIGGAKSHGDISRITARD